MTRLCVRGTDDYHGFIMSTATIPPAAPSLMTAAEFLRLHGDEPGVELVRGRVVRLPMPGLNHGEVVFKTTLVFGQFVTSGQLGRMMTCDSFIPTGEDSVRGADLCYFSYARLPREIPTPKGVADVSPELVVEVRSPSVRLKAIMEKTEEYLEAGVDVVVLIDPAVQTATVFRKDADDRQFTINDELTLPDILPGFSAPVRKFFE
jgi:Uma2 family endonuclease